MQRMLMLMMCFAVLLTSCGHESHILRQIEAQDAEMSPSEQNNQPLQTEEMEMLVQRSEGPINHSLPFVLWTAEAQQNAEADPPTEVPDSGFLNQVMYQYTQVIYSHSEGESSTYFSRFIRIWEHDDGNLYVAHVGAHVNPGNPEYIDNPIPSEDFDAESIESVLWWRYIGPTEIPDSGFLNDVTSKRRVEFKYRKNNVLYSGTIASLHIRIWRHNDGVYAAFRGVNDTFDPGTIRALTSWRYR